MKKKEKVLRTVKKGIVEIIKSKPVKGIIQIETDGMDINEFHEFFREVKRDYKQVGIKVRGNCDFY